MNRVHDYVDFQGKTTILTVVDAAEVKLLRAAHVID